MSTEYDDKIVRMQFDNKNFESGVQTTIASLDQLKASLKFDGVTQGIDNLAGKVKNVSFDNMTQGIEQVVVKIPVMGTVLDQTIRNMTNSVTSFVKTTLDKFSTLGNMKSGFGEYELQIGAVKTIVASTGESVETVNKYLEELNKYADDTIYSFSDMTQNIGKFTNAGVKLEDAVAAIKGIANEAALSGANANEASRAMYNFAQALSAGSVKLIDWKSIENANMATVGFKNELIKTALELGTIRQEGNKYITTTTDLSGKVSEAFDATTLFNESLSHQWMTTKVLTTTLKRYTDTETELGRNATEAATKVNTFHQALDAIIEGLGSSWAQSWQYIIGDFNEATNVWTKFKDTVEGILGPSNDARNAMLKFWATGKDGSEEAIELTEEEIKKYQELYDVAHKGVMGDWGNGQERVEKLTAAGYDYAEVQGTIDKMLAGSVKSWEDLANAQKKEQKVESEGMTGRQMFLKGLSNLSTAIGKFVGAIRDAWSDVFPRKDGNALVAMSAAFMKFTEKLIITDKTADEIRRTFRGLFSVLGLVATIIKAVIKGIGALVNALVSGGKKSDATIWTLTAYIGDLLTMITAIAKESGIFEAIFVGLGKVIGTVGHTGISIIVSLASAVFELIKSFLGLGSAVINLDSITNVFAGCAAAVAGFTDFIADKVAAFGFMPVTGIETFTANVKNAFGFFTQEGGPFAKAVDIFLAAWEKLKIGLMVVAAALAPVVAFIKKRLEALVGGELTLENFLAFLKSGGALVLLAELVGLIHNLRKVLGDFVGVGEATTKMFNTFGDTAKAMTKRLKVMTLKLLAAALFQIAIAIAVMVGAVYVLSKMDDDALKKGILAFSAIMAELIITLREMKAAGIDKAAKTVMALGIAVFLLVKSVKTLGKMDTGDAFVGIFLLKLILGQLVKTVQNISKTIGKLDNVAATLIGLAVAILILTIPVKIFGEMDTDTLIQGIVVVVGLIIILSLAVRLMGKADFNGVAKTLIGMAFALILLIVPIKVLGEMDRDKLLQGGLAVVGLIIILTAAVIALTKFTKDAKIDKGLIGLLWTMVAIVIIFALLTKYLGEMDTDTLLTGIAFIIIFLALIVAFIAITVAVMKDAKNLKELIIVLGIMAGIVALFVILIAILGKMKSDKLEKLPKILLALAVALLVLMAGFILLIKFGSNADFASLLGISAVMISFGLALLGVAAAIYLAVKAFKMLNDMKISDNLIKNISEFGAFLLVVVESLIGGIIGAIIMAGPAIVNGMFTVINLIFENLDNNLSDILYHIGSIIDQTLDFLVDKGPDVALQLLALILGITEALANNADDITEIVENVLEIVCAVIDGLANKVEEINDSIGGLIFSIIDDLANRVYRMTKYLWENVILVIFKRIKLWIKTKILDPAADIGKKIIGSVVGGIIDGLNALAEGIVDAIHDVVQGLISPYNAVRKFLGKNEYEIPEWNVPDIPKPAVIEEWQALAKGGQVSIVGEAGPELLSSRNGKAIVTPLTNTNARNSTKELLAKYAGNISDQLDNINSNMTNATYRSIPTYDDSGILSKVDTMTNSINELKEDILNVRVMLDTGALVGQLASPMDNQLGSINKLRVRAAGSIKR